MYVLKTRFQEGSSDDAHPEISGEPAVTPLLPHPVAPSQDTQDVMSSPIISDDAQGETQENLLAGVDVIIFADIPTPPPNAPNPEPMLVIGSEFVGLESDLPETPEGLEWIPCESGLSHILVGVIPTDSQPSTSFDQKPFYLTPEALTRAAALCAPVNLGLPVLMHGLLPFFGSPPHCGPDGTNDSQRVVVESGSLPDESQLERNDSVARAIALHWANNDITISEAEAMIFVWADAVRDAESQSSVPPLPSISFEVVQSIHAHEPIAKKQRGLSQPFGG